MALLGAVWLLAAGCGAAPPLVQISHSGMGAYEAAMVAEPAGFAVAWHDARDGNSEIYLRVLDVAGQPAGPERRLTETADASYAASLERIGDDYVVAWYEQTSDGMQTAMFGRWNRTGERAWIHDLGPSSRNPVIVSDGRRIFCAWIQTGPDQQEAVWAGWWAGDGEPQRPPVRLAPVRRNTWNLNAVLDTAGVGYVVFDSTASTRASENFLARVDGSEVRVERLTRDDGARSMYPDLALSGDGRAALTWSDERDGNDEEVYLLVTSIAELKGDIDTRARRITTTPGESIGTYVAWNAGRVGLSWSDKLSGQHEIFFQSFDVQGEPLGRARRITNSDTWSLVPAIRPWRNGFALAWNEYQPTGKIHEGTSEVFFTLVEE